MTPLSVPPVQLGLGLINDLILTWGLNPPRALRYILSQEREPSEPHFRYQFACRVLEPELLYFNNKF